MQGGAGGGGASSSAGGSSASGGGSGAAPARAPDLSGIVQAVKKIAEDAKGGGDSKGESSSKSTKGISQARRTYTDKRKVKLGELRALKSKRIREHAASTKKLPKAERAKARKAFKDKVNSQYKEVTKRFPTARGLKDLQTVKGLIDKIDRVRLPS